MKYMTFNNSCAYAGIANLLLDYSINIEDYELALETKVPYIFKYNQYAKRYMSGSQLQDGIYFNSFLHNLNLHLIEHDFDKTAAINFLNTLTHNAMIGLNLINGHKHAVIFTGIEDNKYVFMNNKRKDSTAPDFYRFTLDELVETMDNRVFICYLKTGFEFENIDLVPQVKDSLFYLDEYKDTITKFCNEIQSVKALNESMNFLFHALFLDVYSMMAIIGEDKLSEKISELRSSYLKAIRLNNPLRLSEYISIDELQKTIDDYREVITLWIKTKI